MFTRTVLLAVASSPLQAIVEGPGVFFLGIIDILQDWSLSKRAERWVKSLLLCQDAAGISVMPPAQYADRFLRRVVGQLIDGGKEGDALAAAAAVAAAARTGATRPDSSGSRPGGPWASPPHPHAEEEAFSAARVTRMSSVRR